MKDKLPVGDAVRFGYQATSLRQLLDIITVVSHRQGNTVGGEKRFYLIRRLVKSLQRVTNRFRHGVDETWVIEAHSYLLNDRSARSDLFLCCRDIFSVLTTSTVATEHAGEESQRSLLTIVFHLLKCVGEHRMPVAITPVNRQIDARCGEFFLHRIE